ncbi:hypothetical protein KA005_31745 [bacterium]|nr:hypothetical protein [bacterium]
MLEAEKMLELSHYYYVYSAMVQATGALIALVGVFIIFRLQIQRDIVRDAEDNLLSNKGLGGARKDLERRAEEWLRNNNTNRERTTSAHIFIEENFQNLRLHKSIRKYAIDKGVITIILVTFLFMYYIIVLHLNHFLVTLSPLRPFIGGVIFSIFIVGYLINYIIKCIVTGEKEKKKLRF